MRGRKPKYTPATVAKICDVITETNSDKAAYQMAGIDHATFYRWLKDPDKSEFGEKVARAREAYTGSKNQEVMDNFYKGLNAALLGAEETWTSAETTTLPDGQKVTKASKRTVKRAPAEWAHKIVAPEVSRVDIVHHDSLTPPPREALELLRDELDITLN